MRTFKVIAFVLHLAVTLGVGVKVELRLDNPTSDAQDVTCLVDAKDAHSEITEITQINIFAIFESHNQRLATVNLLTPEVWPGRENIERFSGSIRGREGDVGVRTSVNGTVLSYVCKVWLVNTHFKNVFIEKSRENKNSSVISAIQNMLPGTCPNVNASETFDKLEDKLHERSRKDHAEKLVRKISQVESLVNSTSDQYQAVSEELESLVEDVRAISSTADSLAKAIHPAPSGELTSCERLIRKKNYKGPGRSSRVIITTQGGIPLMCDTVTDGGGWTLFQRRTDGQVDFNRKWTEYEDGFGSLETNFWLGLTNIRRLMATGEWELRIDLKYRGKDYYAVYSNFKVDGPSKNYEISWKSYSGNAGDAFVAINRHGLPFSTKDKGNNGNGQRHCAQIYQSGWWFGHCGLSNLNGIWGLGVDWKDLNGKNVDKQSVSFTELKIRRM